MHPKTFVTPIAHGRTQTKKQSKPIVAAFSEEGGAGEEKKKKRQQGANGDLIEGDEGQTTLAPPLVIEAAGQRYKSRRPSSYT